MPDYSDMDYFLILIRRLCKQIQVFSEKHVSLHLRFRLNNLFGCFDLFALTSFTVDVLTIFQLVKKEVNMEVLSIIGAVGFVQELQVSDEMEKII